MFRRTRRTIGVAMASVIEAALLVSTLWAHTTVVPHHGQDFERIVRGEDKRWLILFITVAFVAAVATLVRFVKRHSRAELPSEDLSAAQQRLKRTLIEVGTVVRPWLGQAPGEVISRTVRAYAECARVRAPDHIGEGPAQSFRFGSDTLEVRYSHAADAKGPRLELVATAEEGGAKLSLHADGRSSVSVFARHD